MNKMHVNKVGFVVAMAVIGIAAMVFVGVSQRIRVSPKFQKEQQKLPTESQVEAQSGNYDGVPKIMSNKRHSGDENSPGEMESRGVNNVAHGAENVDSSINKTLDFRISEIVDKEIPNDRTVNIDNDLRSAGTAFKANMQELASTNEGQKLNISFFGEQYQGEIEHKSISVSGLTQIKIDLAESRQGTYMSIYFGRKVTKGKVYTTSGSYIFEYEGDIGYVMSIFEYKKLKNAIYID